MAVSFNVLRVACLYLCKMNTLAFIKACLSFLSTDKGNWALGMCKGHHQDMKLVSSKIVICCSFLAKTNCAYWCPKSSVKRCAKMELSIENILYMETTLLSIFIVITCFSSCVVCLLSSLLQLRQVFIFLKISA